MQLTTTVDKTAYKMQLALTVDKTPCKTQLASTVDKTPYKTQLHYSFNSSRVTTQQSDDMSCPLVRCDILESTINPSHAKDDISILFSPPFNFN